MVSQGSFFHSDGLPGYMQEITEEDSFEEIKSRRVVEDFPVLVGHSKSLRTKPSNTYGISVVEDASEDEVVPFDDDRAAIEHETINRVAKMAFASNKDERSELIALRLKMIEMQRVLEKMVSLG